MNPITLRIKDKTLQDEFEAIQLNLVKRRWNILTLLFIFTAPLLALMKIGDPDSLIGFLLNLGDCVVVGVIMSLLGWKCTKVHNYSLSVLIFVHGINSIVQTYLLSRESELIDQYTNFTSTN